MEIVFQNKREDFEAFYDYMSKKTEEGKTLSKQAYSQKQLWVIENALFWAALVWGVTGSWKIGLGAFIVVLAFLELIFLAVSGFKPRDYFGRQIYKNQEKWLKPKAIQVFQLPRTLKTDDEWLEISSSESVHRWRWRQVDRIGLTPNFVFIHVGNCPIVYVPKRDFPSKESFMDFGKKLIELQEKDKNQPIGAVG